MVPAQSQVRENGFNPNRLIVTGMKRINKPFRRPPSVVLTVHQSTSRTCETERHIKTVISA